MPRPMGAGGALAAGLRFLPPWTVVGVFVGAAFVDGLPADSSSSSTMMQSSALASGTATSFGSTAVVAIAPTCIMRESEKTERSSIPVQKSRANSGRARLGTPTNSPKVNGSTFGEGGLEPFPKFRQRVRGRCSAVREGLAARLTFVRLLTTVRDVLRSSLLPLSLIPLASTPLWARRSPL